VKKIGGGLVLVCAQRVTLVRSAVSTSCTRPHVWPNHASCSGLDDARPCITTSLLLQYCFFLLRDQMGGGDFNGSVVISIPYPAAPSPLTTTRSICESNSGESKR
jgi:hypothetical protein